MSTSGKSSSSSSSPASGSVGLPGFVQSLRANWRAFVLAFSLGFVVLAVGWWMFAPVYAHLLVLLTRPVVPVIDGTSGTLWVENVSIWTARSIPEPGSPRPAVFKVELWRGYANYDLILLAALIFATPGWSVRQKGRLVVLGLGLLTVAELAFLLVTLEYSQLRPFPTGGGSVLLPPGFSPSREAVFAWIYYFFQTMGRGLFPLLIYWGMIGVAWKPPSKKPSPDPGQRRSR